MIVESDAIQAYEVSFDKDFSSKMNHCELDRTTY